MKWDIFVSHAFEDREFADAIANGLAEKGLRVWFDGFELKVGDSLRRSIDYGLSKSKFGAVVLSPSFFAKEWTQKELDALTSRETKSKKIILPIWHNISAQDIKKYSPTLADRFAINSVIGVEKTVDLLAEKISPEPIQNIALLSTANLELISAELERIKRSLANKEFEIKAILAQADEMAHTDDITYLPNRRRILADLQRETMFAKRYGTPLSIALIAIDHYEKINETHGHLVGDYVLRDFASLIREPILHPDTIGRYRGAALLVVMPHTGLSGAGVIAERLCERIRSTPIICKENTFHLTLSMGMAQYKLDEEWNDLFDRADKALYQAKQNGGNQWIAIDS